MSNWKLQRDDQGELWALVDGPHMVVLRRTADGWCGKVVQSVENRTIGKSDPFGDDLDEAKKWGEAELRWHRW